MTEVITDSGVTRLNGTSGALIISLPGHSVFKYDTPRTGHRVREQGIWLSREPVAKFTSAPEVFNVLPDGYQMEALDRVPLTDQHIPSLIYDVLLTLEHEWWVRQPCGVEQIWVGDDRVDFSPRSHARYVDQLCRQVSCRDLVKPLAGYAKLINWYQLQRVLTHGDPIVDNVMYRKNDLVLIDPLPPTISVPSLRCVDVGRLIQSLVGYEAARYGFEPRSASTTVSDRVGPHPTSVTELLNATLPEFDLNEARASLYWSVIHMMRGLRTALNTPGEKPVRHLVYHLTDRIVKKWMR